MKILNIIKLNESLKGLILGLLCLFILEFGTIAVMAGFATIGLWNYENIQYYYLLLIFNAIISSLIFIGIAKKIIIIKIMAFIFSIIIIIMIIAGYSYFLWFRITYII